MDWTWYLFSFKGRINRAKYWLAGLVIVALMMIFVALVYAALMINLVAVAMGTPHGQGEISFTIGLGDILSLLEAKTWRTFSLAGLPMLMIRTLGSAVFLWMFAATSIKRLHDRDKSAWWMLPFIVVPIFFNHLADLLPGSWLTLIVGAFMLALMIWGFVELYFLSGSRKTNRFGANPLLVTETGPRWEQQSEIEMVPHKASPPPLWRVKSGS
jgi:uncharacterized membrane protein YhaH (DUF805 family)